MVLGLNAVEETWPLWPHSEQEAAVLGLPHGTRRADAEATEYNVANRDVWMVTSSHRAVAVDGGCGRAGAGYLPRW